MKNLWRPSVLRYFIGVVRSDDTSIPPVTAVESFSDGSVLDVPGQPHVIHIPGHTEDEVAFYCPDRDVLFSGDALATVDFERWQGNNPQPMPSWLNVGHEQARVSFTRLELLREVILLPGHGEPWTGNLTEPLRAE